MLAEHFGPGQMQPLNVVAIDPARFDTPQGLARIAELQRLLQASPHVTAVRSFTGSLPDANTLSVADQLGVEAAVVREGLATLATVAGSTGGGGEAGAVTGEAAAAALEAAAAQLTDLFGYLQQLAGAYPEATADPGYAASMAALGELASLAGRATAEPGAAAQEAPSS